MWDFKVEGNMEYAARSCEALLNFDVAVQNYWNDRESPKPEFLESLSQMIDASIELQKYMEKK